MPLTQTDIAGCHLDQFVIVDIGNRLLEPEPARPRPIWNVIRWPLKYGVVVFCVIIVTGCLFYAPRGVGCGMVEIEQTGRLLDAEGRPLVGAWVLAAWLLSGNSGGFWTFALVWAIVLHTSFVLWGIIAMAQAMLDRMPYFPRRWL